MDKYEYHVGKIVYNPYIKNYMMCVRYRTNILWWYQICTKTGKILGKERQAKYKYNKFNWKKPREELWK